jgi:hypothetical protein
MRVELKAGKNKKKTSESFLLRAKAVNLAKAEAVQQTFHRFSLETVSEK